MRSSNMRIWLVVLALLIVRALPAQDSTRVSPKWVFEILLGGGGSDEVSVRTGPDEQRSMDLAGWFHLRFAGERALGERWSSRLAIGFATGGWEGGRGGNPFAAPSAQGDRWDVAVGAGYQLYRGRRSQFALTGELRGVFGMDLSTDYQTDTAWVAASFQQVRMFYRPALSPQLAAVWRLRIGPGPFGATLRVGVEHYSYTYSRSERSAGLPELPDGLEPLTGTHTGFAYTWSIGFFGWD